MSEARRALPFILGTIFIDAIGFGIIMPVLPQLLMDVGGIALPQAIELGTWIGLMMAVATFFAAPVLGNLSDRYGRRPVLLFSLGGLAIDYALLAIVQTIPLLFVARVLSGVFGGSFAPAQAAIADITEPAERARNFGLVSAAFGVGFVAGPAIGGLLGELGPRAPFIAAAVLSAINFIYGLVLFPDTLAPQRRRSFSWRRANPLGAWRTMRGLAGMTAVALVLVLWQIASLVYPLTWSFYAIAQLGWSSSMIGASLAMVGVVIALGQTLVTGRMVKRFGERDAASIGLVFAVTGYLGYAFADQTWMAFALLPLLAFSSPVQPAIMAMLSRRATADTQGEVQGVAAMAMGIGSLIAPVILTGTMARFTADDAPMRFAGAAFLVAALFGIAALVMIRRLPKGTRDGSDQIPPAVAV
jgi:DHA1 family tetracycline resistance protein-like MFS transporter